MKQLTLGLLLITLVGCQQKAPQTTPQTPTTPQLESISKEECMALLDRWEEAMMEKDSVKLKSVLHPSYYYAGSPDGSLANRQAMMEWVAGDPGQLLSQQFNDMDIQIYQNVAIVRGWEIMTALTAEGDTTKYKLRFTDVYQKENGVVQALSTHSSPMD